MDGLSLLRQARNAGLRLEAAGDKLKIVGPKRAEPVVKLLAAHKAEVLAALATTPREIGSLSQTAQFEQLAPLEEPALEQPCAARRGQVRQDGKTFLHFCVDCGAFGPFGYGVSLRTGQLGRWYCSKHRPGTGVKSAAAHRRAKQKGILACRATCKTGENYVNRLPSSKRYCCA